MTREHVTGSFIQAVWNTVQNMDGFHATYIPLRFIPMYNLTVYSPRLTVMQCPDSVYDDMSLPVPDRGEFNASHVTVLQR